MINQQENEMRDLELKMVDAVSRKLGINVQFSHWIKKITGDVPVFIVPEHCATAARNLGLTVKTI